MMWAAIVLGVIGVVAAGLLYVVARRFSVDDDPRIDQVEGLLPGANCGGCGFSGCRAFAQACCNATSLEGLSCPGSDRSTMGRIASVLGLRNDSCSDVRRVAIVGCGAKCGGRQEVALYDGPASCVAVAAIGSGESLCSYGCVGMGDCVGVCPFDAMSVNSETKIPEVDHSRCTGCGRCAERCPRSVISIRQVRVQAVFRYVACSNASPGQLAVKACRSACIACGKCERVCASSAITFGRCGDGVSRVAPARIDAMKCTGCGMCGSACPTGAIRMAEG